jgi:hypothetical protein
MSAPVESLIPAPRLFTVADYIELGETERGYTELHEGHLLVWPNQSVRHGIATSNLAFSSTPKFLMIFTSSPARCRPRAGKAGRARVRPAS